MSKMSKRTSSDCVVISKEFGQSSSSTEQKVTLSSLASQLTYQARQKQVRFNLVCLDNTQVTLIDDLFLDGLIDVVVELTIHAHAQVSYKGQFAPAINRVLPLSQETGSFTPAIRFDEKMLEQEKSYKHHLVLTVVGSQSHAEVEMAFLATSKDTFFIKTTQDHQAPNSTSTLTVKTVVDGEAVVRSFNETRVAKGAQQTRTEQINKNILLTEKARAISVPMLEVEADDVSCIHGSAVSQPSAELYFYLQSRGLSPAIARAMYLRGFLQML